MTITIWTAPAAPNSPHDVRRAILAQHASLRELLHKARGVAEDALDGNQPAPDSVASAVGDIRTAFEVHLTFEERVMPSFLQAGTEAADLWVARARGEHRKQRDVLATLHGEAKVAPELPTLAAKLAFLTTWLLRDMAEEERGMG
jgi:hypothetical protein